MAVLSGDWEHTAVIGTSTRDNVRADAALRGFGQLNSRLRLESGYTLRMLADEWLAFRAERAVAVRACQQ